VVTKVRSATPSLIKPSVVVSSAGVLDEPSMRTE